VIASNSSNDQDGKHKFVGASEGVRKWKGSEGEKIGGGGGEEEEQEEEEEEGDLKL
jgi:hypothetical protein